MSKNNEMRSCKGCIWYDECDHEERCDGYYSQKYEEQLARSEYENDLRERVDTYNEIIEEFNN